MCGTGAAKGLVCVCVFLLPQQPSLRSEGELSRDLYHGLCQNTVRRPVFFQRAYQPCFVLYPLGSLGTIGPKTVGSC